MTPEEIKKHVSRATTRAANFKRVDLQVHSDESDDFPQPCDFGNIRFEPGPSDKKPLAPSTILQTAGDKGLDLFAVTDHMRSRKSCEVATASLKTHGGGLALPGIEVNILLTQVSHSSRDSVHMLCIFKEGKSSEDIERIFHTARALKPYEDRSNKDAIEIDLKTFVENVHKNDGICIASHVNSEKGLRRAFFQWPRLTMSCARTKNLCSKNRRIYRIGTRRRRPRLPQTRRSALPDASSIRPIISRFGYPFSADCFKRVLYFSAIRLTSAMESPTGAEGNVLRW